MPDEIYCSRRGVIIGTLNSVDVVEIVECGGNIWEIYEGFLCHILQYVSYTESLNEMVAERDRHKKQGKDLLQTMAKKIANSVYGDTVVISNGMSTAKLNLLHIFG